MGIGALGGFYQLFDDMAGGGSVGIAHPKVHHILPPGSGRGLQFIDDGKYIGRQAADSLELGVQGGALLRVGKNKVEKQYWRTSPLSIEPGNHSGMWGYNDAHTHSADPIMRLNYDLDTSQNVIRSYDRGHIVLNEGQVIRQSVVVLPDRLITDWPPQRFEDLTAAHFEQLLTWEPEIVLLGTGAQQRFPHPRLTRSLLERGIGVEVMATDAACRTYAIIMSEGRRVAAALLMI